MDAKEAKALSLEVWAYLRDHPAIDRKEQLPDELWMQIVDMDSYCPLCEYFIDNNDCEGCPLDIGRPCGDGYYERWYNAYRYQDRSRFAGRIFDMISEWEV